MLDANGNEAQAAFTMGFLFFVLFVAALLVGVLAAVLKENNHE